MVKEIGKGWKFYIKKVNGVLNTYMTDFNIILVFQEPQKTGFWRRRHWHWANQKVKR